LNGNPPVSQTDLIRWFLDRAESEMSPVSNEETQNLAGRWPRSAWEFVQFILGLAVLYVLFEWLGRALGSDRGQAGWIIGAAIVVGCMLVKRFLRGETPLQSFRSLGLGFPAVRGIIAAVVVCGLLLAIVPAYVTWTGATPALLPGWLIMLGGMFAQAGIAEETLFRGYGFGQLRQGRVFWTAAWLASLPFVLVHLPMFALMPFPVALASVGLSVIISFPLAHLYELGGKTIWAPALVHWIVQSGVKVLDLETMGQQFALVWIAACAVLPFASFLFRRRPSTATD
jgi:membrane protease YdiL (CAAX protease family)